MTQAQLILAWRGYANEWDTVQVPDSGSTTAENVLDYLQRGAEATNDVLGFFCKDATITLAAGAESAIPTDMLEIVFVTVDNQKLHKTDIEQLQEAQPDWRTRPSGLPKEYYVYSKIGFFPQPDLASAALTCTMRHIATPTISTTPGFDLLATAHHRIPVYYAVGLWFDAHGLDGDGFRAKNFKQMWADECKLVKPFYEARRVARGLG